MGVPTVKKREGNEYMVHDGNGRLKAKHMSKERAERFAKSLGWSKPHTKGSTEPKKKDVKEAKKPVK